MAEREHLLGRRNSPATYADDYGAWVTQQVALLRSGCIDRLDRENLAEEVEDLGKSDFHKATSAIEIVLIHMLKWDYQPTRRARSWSLSIIEHRLRLEAELKSSPSYRNRIKKAVGGIFKIARVRAARETKLPLQTFPETCPYDWDEIISREHPLDGEA